VSAPSIRCPINATDGIRERYFATCERRTGWSSSARSVCSRVLPPRVEARLGRRLEAQEGQFLGRQLLRAERRRLQGGQPAEDLIHASSSVRVRGELTRGVLRFHLVCPEGVTRNSALDYPVYPEIVEARDRLAAR
jgi:hypothetical protein